MYNQGQGERKTTNSGNIAGNMVKYKENPNNLINEKTILQRKVIEENGKTITISNKYESMFNLTRNKEECDNITMTLLFPNVKLAKITEN